jgi:hypothetical protein
VGHSAVAVLLCPAQAHPAPRNRAPPRLLQVFTCLTDCVELGGAARTQSFLDLHRANGPASSAPLARVRVPHFRRLLPFEDPDDVETCSVIVMEVGGGWGVVRIRILEGGGGRVRGKWVGPTCLQNLTAARIGFSAAPFL